MMKTNPEALARLNRIHQTKALLQRTAVGRSASRSGATSVESSTPAFRVAGDLILVLGITVFDLCVFSQPDCGVGRSETKSLSVNNYTLSKDD